MDNELEQEISEYVNRFGSIGVKYGIGEFWNREDVIKRLKELSNEDVSEKLAHVKSLPAEREKRVQEVLAKLNADEQFKELVKTARMFVYLRTYRTDKISNSFANGFRLFEEIGRRCGISRREVIDCPPNEIVAMEFPPSEKIIERAKAVITKGINGKVYFTDGKTAIKLKEKLESAVGNDKAEENVEQELRGMAAFKGKVQGKAKIILDNTDLNKVERGDILVAAMTTPDFVPAMERAAGFVTNEGGILCHAAIIAREMKKPCITGTKIATKLIKDGDIIEVDAEQGIVRLVDQVE